MLMYYTIRHVNKFRYSAPIRESMMEVRIKPRSEGYQRSLDFRLNTSPRSQPMGYRAENGMVDSGVADVSVLREQIASLADER